MEFFEQAHVAKAAESTKKEESIKKQLKQMLHGYKTKDNDLIKSSMELKNDSDDSSSVSRFSDLNLTVSSSSEANDITRATTGSPDDVDSIVGELNTNVSPKITNLTLDSDNEKLSERDDSISENITSMKEDLNRDIDENSSLESGDELSFLSYSFNTLTDTESSQEFDPDGSLATKIHQNLKKKVPKKAPKRKLEKIDSNSEDDIPSKIQSSSKDNKVSSLHQKQHPRLIKDDLLALDTAVNISISDKSLVKPPVLSPPYITINAAEIKETFEDVVGKYKNPIIKNIRSDNNELMFSMNKPNFYSETEMTIDEKDMDEETDSLNLTNDEEVSKEKTVGGIEADQVIATEDNVESIDTESQESLNLTENNIEDSVKFIFRGSLCICLMKYPAKLFVHGKLKVKCLAGSVEVFGYSLTDKPNEIYAPFSSFAQCLTVVKKDTRLCGLFGKLTAVGLTVADSEDIVTTIGAYSAVLVLEPLQSIKMNFVEEHFSVTNLFKKSSKHTYSFHNKALETLACCIYTTLPPKIFEVPTSWQNINKYCFKEQSRGILCGGKGTGKSTCLRYHVNRLLPYGPVLVIDLDIGQSEFTVPGNISANVINEPLLGPNFTHLRRPKRSLNLGMINPLDDMCRYINAVDTLINYCAIDEQLKGMRWIVNTMGLCDIIGLHFITITIILCQPTYLLQIDSKNVKKRFPILLRPQLVAEHYEQYKHIPPFYDSLCANNLDYSFIESHHTEMTIRINTLAPRDERYLNFLAYFGELLQIHKSASLLAISPYEVQLQDLCVYTNVKIPEGTVQHMLNGKIVALCQHELDSVTEEPYVLEEVPLLCRGHGLIRGIDFEKQVLYLLTPLPIEELRLVDTLLYADWVPELRGQEVSLLAGTIVPFRMSTMYQQKQLMSAPCRRFNPVLLAKVTKHPKLKALFIG